VPSSDKVIAVDSDGCVFDSMSAKHQNAFLPAFIHVFQLEPIRRAANEVWDFVNLNGRSRGVNRFEAVALAFDLLANHPGVAEAGARLPTSHSIRAWLKRNRDHSAGALEADPDTARDPLLAALLEWTREVDRRTAELPASRPFADAPEALAEVSAKARIVVVSQAPAAVLENEWRGADLARYVSRIGGQECGTKASQIRKEAEAESNPGPVLMVGDAPGDLAAAREARTAFFPIIPGKESESWRRFREEALPAFFAGNFSTDYQTALTASFEEALPETPPWTR